MDHSPSYAVKYVGVVDGEVGITSRRVQSRTTKGPLSPANLRSLKPNRLLERLLQSRKFEEQQRIPICIEQDEKGDQEDPNLEVDVNNSAELVAKTKERKKFNERTQEVKLLNRSNANLKSEGSLYASLEMSSLSSPRKFLQHRFSDLRQSSQLLRGLETNLKKGSQVVLQNRNSTKLNKDIRNVTFSDQFIGPKNKPNLRIFSSVVNKRKAELGQMGEQTHCHMVNLKLSDSLLNSRQEQDTKRTSLKTAGCPRSEKLNSFNPGIRPESSSPFENTGSRCSLRQSPKYKPIFAANIVRIRNSTVGPRSRAALKDKLKKPISDRVFYRRNEIDGDDFANTSRMGDLIEQILSHNVTNRAHYTNFLKNMLQKAGSVQKRAVTRPHIRLEESHTRRESLGFSRIGNQFTPVSNYISRDIPKDMMSRSTLDPSISTEFIVNKYLAPGSVFSMKNEQKQEEERSKSPMRTYKELGGLVVPIKSKLNLAKMYQSTQFKETPRHISREFRRITRPVRNSSRMQSPRAKTAGGYRQVQYEKEITFPIQKIIIPPPPQSSMQFSKVLETLTSEERTGSVIDADSAHHQDSTIAPSSSVVRREPIRVDYIKCKTPSKFGRGKNKMNTPEGQNTNLNSVYEETTSPRLEQRFDVKLESKYIRAFKLKSEKKSKHKQEAPFSVVGFSMK